MKLQLKNWKVASLRFNLLSMNESETEGNDVLFSVGNSFSDANSHEFCIGFKAKVSDKNYTLDLEIMYVFETDQEITEEFKNSNFVKINAPAIAFPYFRSYLTIFAMQSGLKPIIMPSVNFVNLKN